MKERKTIKVKEYESPCGTMQIGSLDNKLCMCDWFNDSHHKKVKKRLERLLHANLVEGTSEVIDQAIHELDEYFAGTRKDFDVQLLTVGTDMQQEVWRELQNTPYGTTISYKDLAGRMGRAEAVRAVANAVGNNAISIFVPCHRVIGSNKALTGYAGGIDTKRNLLKLEGGGYKALLTMQRDNS